MRRKASVVIVSVLVIAIALIGISTLLSSSYLTGYQLDKSEFRGTVTQIVTSSKGAVAMALADVSKCLNQRVKTYPPSPYYDPFQATLSTSEINEGYSILSQYQNNLRASYPGTGLIVNYVDSIFVSNWTNTVKRTGYTLARANVTIDLPNIGFRGLENYVEVEVNATLKNLISTDGRIISFTVNLLSEGDNPIDNLDRGLVNVYFANYTTSVYKTYTLFDVNSLQYTNGTYLVTCGSEFQTIDANVANLTTTINTLPDANFTSTSEKALILSTLSEIGSKYSSYHSGDRSQSWLSNAWIQMYEVRTKMDHASSGCVVKAGIDTQSILNVIDLSLSQLKPIIRIVVTDFRGITVSAFGECGTETILPMVLYEKAVAGTGGSYTLTATADNHLSDNDNIVRAEYYVSPSLTTRGAIARSMSALDGSFNQPVEKLTASISSGYLNIGTNYIWIRAQDSKGHWSDYVKVKIPGYLHLKVIDSVGNVYITMAGYSSGSGNGAKYWATATVRVVDDAGNAISGVSVKGTWSGSYVSTNTLTTSATGYCTFETTHNKYTDWLTLGGYKTFTMTISSITKSGYQWIDPTQSDTIRLTSSKTWIS